MKCSEYLLDAFITRMLHLLKEVVKRKSYIFVLGESDLINWSSEPGGVDVIISEQFERLGGTIKRNRGEDGVLDVYWMTPYESTLYTLIEEDSIGDAYYLIEFRDGREYFLKITSEHFEIVDELPAPVLDGLLERAVKDLPDIIGEGLSSP